MIAASPHTAVFDKLIRKLDEITMESDFYLDSRLIRLCVYNTYTTKYIIPSLAEKMLLYIYENRDAVSGDTIGKVMHCFYKLGYDPPQTIAMQKIDFDELALAFNHDFDYMTGFVIVKSCLALCYFHALPYNIIDRIFHIDFITRLEEEMKQGYSKVEYIHQLSHQIYFIIFHNM